MGKVNTITKDYMSNPKYFADSFNYYLFDGKQIIKADNLETLDPTEMAIIPKEASDETVEKIRDVLKQCILMTDDRATYLMMGIENQTDVHYALPVKNMIYDALNYGKQVSETAKRHREEKDLQGSAEFLSGFTKNDKLKPLITLTIYFGSDEWDAPRSLKEMFNTTDETILRFVEDYRVHLIIPKEIKDFSRFATDFGKAMRFIALSEDKDSLWKLQQDEQYKTVDTETVRLINACTKGNLPIEEKEEIDMCKGLEGIREDGKIEGKIEGIALTKKVYKLERNGKSAEEIAKECSISVAEVEEILK